MNCAVSGFRHISSDNGEETSTVPLSKRRPGLGHGIFRKSFSFEHVTHSDDEEETSTVPLSKRRPGLGHGIFRKSFSFGHVTSDDEEETSTVPLRKRRPRLSNGTFTSDDDEEETSTVPLHKRRPRLSNGTFRKSLSFRHVTSDDDEKETSTVPLGKRRPGLGHGISWISFFFRHVTSNDDEEETSTVPALRKRRSLLTEDPEDMGIKRNGTFRESFLKNVTLEDDEKENSKVSCKSKLLQLSPTTQRKPKKDTGTRIKRNRLLKQSYDGCVSSGDERDEDVMSMVSFYKFSKKPIGLGAFGTCVYPGVNTKDGRKVAIKKINCHTPKQTRQYKREVKYLLLLSGCPNIVKYLDVEVEQNIVYIMLELMEGTLETLVNRPNLKIKFTQSCQDIISALDFLHNQSTKTIIHRDIKPRNILFISSPRLMLKLADFGLSKMLDSDSSSIGYNGGTRCWMAPEVHRSLDQFSTASDVFASGLVLHYLMTSRNPFAPKDVTCNKENRLLVEHDIVHNILNQNLNVDSSLSPEAVHLIDEMLKDERDQRPTAEEVLAHPFFWSDQKKLKFLEATANQPEIFQRGVNDFKKDLELTHLGAQFQTVPWSEQSPTMAYVYDEMMVAGRRSYDTKSVAELLRFMRNAYQHVSGEPERTSLFQVYLLNDFIFLEEFKSLFIDVYETVLEHEWDKNKKEIMYAMS